MLKNIQKEKGSQQCESSIIIHTTENVYALMCACKKTGTVLLSAAPPDHRGRLDLSQRVNGRRRRRRRRVVGSGIHSVPGAIQQLVHLAVGQRGQREGPVQLLHVQRSPERTEQTGLGLNFICISYFLPLHTSTTLSV